MSSIPLPALQVQQQPQPDTIGNLSRVLQIRNLLQNAPLQTQALQQQVQSGALQIQQQQQDIAARQALNAAYAGAVSKDENGNPTFDEGKMQQSLMGGPAAYQTPQVMKGLADFKKSQIDVQSSAADLQAKQTNMLGNAAAAIKASNYDPTVAHALLDQFPQNPQTQQIRATLDNPAMLKQWTDTAIANSPDQQKLQGAKDVAGIRANTPEMQEMNDWMAKNPGKTASDYQQFKVDQGVQADVNKETNPAVIGAKETLSAAEAAQRQAVTQGDPNAAAKLLISGDATLSELKARGSTPDFISKTLAAADQMSGGKYNAQAADAQYDVAKSPANVAFFGSAKSLTDKGGTLDQLAAAAKNIPAGQIPAFNSIADWEKAATGSGPIAKYASLALGVADDYSKVMGGGQGSDASRLQALKLVGANQSPDQRAASIDGIRGAVNSQNNSRIGSNPVLQRMYGSNGGSQAPPRPAGVPANAVWNPQGNSGRGSWRIQ